MTIQAPTLLAEHHALDAFDSGVVLLDDWLKRRARANQASGASRTYVVAEDGRVIAYYALASSNIAVREATGRLRRNMPEHIPVVTLARLAVDRRFQKRGLGRGLVQDAAKRVMAAADIIGIRGMIVHAIHDDARQFYLEMGFLPSPTSDMTLMISLADLQASI
ncbi:MAG: GNAT family N-acetyltransferase [Azonexus sp.]|jgi:GNAT superfamily N-acetyltransferase|uniref:GNAT family N-acetyltransferase n=1 Tax=Azonexus sp. TaxID=1872668 RepID=UPI00281E49C5|nr:GNAT family N-acetyltransferase [Azonexus sp.]MDR0776221.1 GNAT family N-acetyltransferase [Azonexus sp.]